MNRSLILLFILILFTTVCCTTATISDRNAGTENKWILGTHSLAIPGKNWSLLVDLAGFKLEKEVTLPDASATMVYASNGSTHLVVSVYLESRPDLDSTDACKAYYWGKASQSPIPKSEVRHGTFGSMATVHFLIREFKGVSVMQKNVNGYLYHDGVCVDVHVSKVHYQPKDEALFDAVLESVHIPELNIARASQSTSLVRPPLLSVLNTPELQWVFKHICVPLRQLPADGYTQGDFVEAYLEFYRSRWEVSLAAMRNGDQDTWIKYFAPISHSIIDLYWPSRVIRDSEGAIIRFRDCNSFGNLQGILRNEHSISGPSSKDLKAADVYGLQIMKKWKDGRPFDEVEEILRSGPIKLAEPSASIPLERK